MLSILEQWENKSTDPKVGAHFTGMLGVASMWCKKTNMPRKKEIINITAQKHEQCWYELPTKSRRMSLQI